jgi:hypothetical protein
MAHPTAVVFALSMAVWVADVRFAPVHASVSLPPDRAVAACEGGLSPAAPPGADAEVVTCGARLGSK